MEFTQRTFIFIITCVALIAIIISLFEIHRSKRIARFKSLPPYTYFVVLPKYSGLKHPMYVYNTVKTHRRDIKYEPGYVADDYVKYRIHEHLVSQLGRNVNKMLGFAKMSFKSKVPINTLYQSLRTSSDIMNAINPMTIDPTKYKALIHKDDIRSDIFISDGMLYIV